MKTVATTFACLFFVFGACGDDKEQFDIDPNKRLSELNDDEVRTLCDFQEFFVNEDARLKVTCFADASVETDDAACTMAAETCIENDDFEATDCDTITFIESTISSCSNTPIVSDLQTCLLADAEFFRDLAERVTCANVVEESQTLPEDCQIIGLECPEFFATEDGVESLVALKSRFDKSRRNASRQP